MPQWVTYQYPFDAIYDRGITFPLKCFLDDGAPDPNNRRNANLVSKNDVMVYLGHGILHLDAL